MPAGSKSVKVSLSAAETNAENIRVTFSDQAGEEWADITFCIPTVAQQIDDLASAAELTNLANRDEVIS